MKNAICFITGNSSKFREAELILKQAGIGLVQKDVKLIEPQATGQEKVVLEKAEQAYSILKQPVIVDDTGIYFEEYNNFPGAYTKTVFESIGIKGIERLLKGASRKASFKTWLCYKDANETKVFAGEWKGKICEKASKVFNPDWGYNSIFIPEGCKKPLSEIPLEERAKKSHRKKAFDELLKYLGELK